MSFASLKKSNFQDLLSKAESLNKSETKAGPDETATPLRPQLWSELEWATTLARIGKGKCTKAGGFGICFSDMC